MGLKVLFENAASFSDSHIYKGAPLPELLLIFNYTTLETCKPNRSNSYILVHTSAWLLHK